MSETDDITIEVPGPNKIIIHGADKQKVRTVRRGGPREASAREPL